MTTEVTKAPDKAVLGAFAAGTVTEKSAPVPHLPSDYANIASTTISAIITPPSEGDAGLDHDLLADMYRFVALARALDERMWQLNRAGRAPFVVSGQGHEAAQVGAAFALERGTDFIVPYYRDLALSLVFGLTARDVMMVGAGPRRRPDLRRPADARALRFCQAATSSPLPARSRRRSRTRPASPTPPSCVAHSKSR